MKSKQQQKNLVKYPIGFKLVFMIITLLLVSLGAITVLVSVLISQDVRVTAEDTNFTTNTRSASEAENILKARRSNTLILLNTLSALGYSTDTGRQTTDFFFGESPDIAAITLPLDSVRLINDQFFLANEIDSSLVDTFLDIHSADLQKAAEGEAMLLNGAPVFEIPLLVMFIPLGGDRAAAAFFSSDSLTEAFGTGSNVSFMINNAGDVLVHPDHSLVRNGTNIGGQAFIKSIQESKDDSRQTLYTDEQGMRYFGAFTKLRQSGSVVITNVEYNLVFEGINATTRRNIYLTIGVLFVAILFVWFFSKTISIPLKNLSKATGRIKEGEFDIKLISKSRDEITLLTRNFMEMGQGLAERERLKITFGKFTNKAVAERAMKGELTLGGELKTVTIFFSDIRSFTEISEKLEPHETVEFVNAYITQMVTCIDKTGGIVDKFIGDSVMAIWGAPVSTGSPKQDALSCVRTALLMRASLKEFNRDRGGDDKKPLIKIGCGINTGDVVAGQIGSTERMEYTVIGDAVNLASRTEGLNKPLGTDILITENTWDLVKDYIIAEEMPPVTVKGKEKPIKLFAVINLKVDNPDVPQPLPVTLAEIREQLGTTAPNLNTVISSEKEKKYKIQE
jgi:adenylate cyclase